MILIKNNLYTLFVSILLLFFSFVEINNGQANEKEFEKFLLENYSRQSVENLRELLRIPNIASNKEDISANIHFLENKFSDLNFNCYRLESKGNPQFLIERIMDKSLPTILFYMQLDGQPVDSSKWNQEDPFTPMLKKKNMEGDWEIIDWKSSENNVNDEHRVFARAASDAKGPIAMFISALEIMDSLNINQNINIKAIFDTEEEIGSPHLVDVIKRNKKLLNADYIVVLDGPQHLSNKPTLLLGARGIITIRLKVFGTYFPQHSGHYGNYAPNPAFKLAKLLASMKDDKGRVLIKGFYDGIHLDADTKEILSSVPDSEHSIKEKLGIAFPDSVGNNYQESIQYPSLNINGIQSAWVGAQARTIVPSEAEARLDIRTVVESDPYKLIDLLRNYIEEQEFHFVENEPTKEERIKFKNIISFKPTYSYPAFRTNLGTPLDKWLSKVLYKTHKIKPIKIRQTGGSIPIAHFINELGIPAVILPTVNPDNNQHSPNENIRLGNYFDGIITLINVLTTSIE